MTTTHTTRQLVDLAHAGVRPAAGVVWAVPTALPLCTLELRVDGLHYVWATKDTSDEALAPIVDAMRDEELYGPLARAMRAA